MVRRRRVMNYICDDKDKGHEEVLWVEAGGNRVYSLRVAFGSLSFF